MKKLNLLWLAILAALIIGACATVTPTTETQVTPVMRSTDENTGAHVLGATVTPQFFVVATYTPEPGTVADQTHAPAGEDVIYVSEHLLVNTSQNGAVALKVDSTMERYYLDVIYGDSMVFPVSFSILGYTGTEGLWVVQNGTDSFYATSGTIFSVYHNDLYSGAVLLTHGGIARIDLPPAFVTYASVVFDDTHKATINVLHGFHTDVVLTMTNGAILQFKSPWTGIENPVK